VSSDTMLLPIPTEKECIEVAVLLESSALADYPRHKDALTELLSHGQLCDGRRVWIVYYAGLEFQRDYGQALLIAP
jgi:hypothetical protein